MTSFLQTMLQALEKATLRLKRNESLKRAVYESDDIAQKIHRSTAAACLKRGQEAQSALEQTVAQLEEYHRDVSFTDVQHFDPTCFLKECGQQTALDELVKDGDQGSTEGALRVGETVKNLMRKTKDNQGHLKKFLADGLQSIDKACTLLQETSLNSDQWASVPDSLLMLIGEVLDQEQVAALLEEHHETIKRMQFNADELTEQQQQAVVDGDMKLSETLYFKKITVQEAMVEVFNKAYTLLDVHGDEAFVTPLKRVHEVHNRVTSEMSAIMQKNDAVKSKVEGDLQRLNDHKKQLQDSDNSIASQYQSFVRENDRHLKENASGVIQCYEAIAELERKLEQLSRDRSDLVQRRIAAVDAEARRRADIANFFTFYNQQCKLLEATLQTCEVAEEVSDIFDEMLCNGCNALEQTMRDVDASIEDERMKLHETRLSHFRDLYLTLGELQFKKERNLEELEKKISHVHIQQELAMETFNPKAKEFSEMKKSLSKVKDEMNSQLAVLEEKATLHIEAFKPTEVALIESGKSFVHPVEELTKRNEMRQQKLLEYHTLMSQDEDTAPPEEIEAELRQLEEQRKSMPRKKPLTPASPTRPSS